MSNDLCGFAENQEPFSPSKETIRLTEPEPIPPHIRKKSAASTTSTPNDFARSGFDLTASWPRRSALSCPTAADRAPAIALFVGTANPVFLIPPAPSRMVNVMPVNGQAPLISPSAGLPKPAGSLLPIPPWVWVALPLVVAACLRLYGIGGPEPFVDEGANILTSLDGRVEEAFEPLAQGRPWIIYLFKPAGWFSAHALVVARFMSAGAGLVTTVSIGWTLFLLSGFRSAVCGMWLWALLPYAVFHERLALQDPFVTALLAVAIGLITKASRSPAPRPTWWYFLLAGGCWGTAFLLKISAFLALPWLGLTYLMLRRQTATSWFDRNLALLVVGMLVPIASLGPDLLQLGSQLGRYHALPSMESTSFASTAWQHFKIWIGWYEGYDGPWLLPMAALTAIGVVWARNRQPLVFGLGWMFALLTTSLFYNNTFARYALPDHVPLILFLGLGADAILRSTNRWHPVGLGVILVPVLWWGKVGVQMARSPEASPVPKAEIIQYYTGPWSGSGVNEVEQFLTDHADRHRVQCVVFTFPFLRPGCYGLMLAQLRNPRFTVFPLALYGRDLFEQIRPQIKDLSRGKPLAFFILFEGRLYPAPAWVNQTDGPARRVLEVTRENQSKFSLYEITP